MTQGKLQVRYHFWGQSPHRIKLTLPFVLLWAYSLTYRTTNQLRCNNQGPLVRLYNLGSTQNLSGTKHIAFDRPHIKAIFHHIVTNLPYIGVQEIKHIHKKVNTISFIVLSNFFTVFDEYPSASATYLRLHKHTIRCTMRYALNTNQDYTWLHTGKLQLVAILI